MLTHAGNLVYRPAEDGPLFLVVSSSDGAHWVLPKGHIKPGESPEEAALRELEEEAGVMGTIIARLPVKEFDKGKETAIVQYYLVEESGLRQAEEARKIRWEDGHATLELLSFDNEKEILLYGEGKIDVYSFPHGFTNTNKIQEVEK
jgi:8-oxo-dGTP pyrophosphatase MutT (NUDIX family)